MKQSVGILLALAIASVPMQASATSKRDVAVPAGYRQPVQIVRKSSQWSCPTAPTPFKSVLDIPSKYEGSDSARATENPEAKARALAATKPISDMEKGFAAMVRKYMRTGNSQVLDCAMSWLDGWARADALTNRAPTHTGRSVRKWALASFASSYLRLRESETKPIGDDLVRRHNIEQWFGKLANQVITEWPVDDPIDRFNNHYYWVGWSLMATAAATDRWDLFEAALGYYRVFEQQVDSDGYLPAELSRKSRALSYHAYALGPLAMIASFGKANGVDLVTGGSGALTRLADRTSIGLESPESFAARAGAAQDPTSIGKRGNWAWVEPYCATVSCDTRLLDARRRNAPQVNTRLGGDLTALFSDDSTP